MAQVIRVYDTEANALAGGSSGLISLGARVDNSGGAIHNSNDSIPFYVYNKYYYRIDANEPVIEFHIDWDDGENNSPSKANIQIVKLSTPSFYTIVEHIYTESKRFFPLIRVKSVEGFLSKWYTNDSSDNIFTELEPYTVSAGQNQFSEVSREKATSDLIPHFIPARFPPVAVLKTNRKSIFSGIDNSQIDAITTAQYPLLYAYTNSSGTPLQSGAIKGCVKLTVMGREDRAIREYILPAASILRNDAHLSDNGAAGDEELSELATRAVPVGNYEQASGSAAYETVTLNIMTDGNGGTAPNQGEKEDLLGDYVIMYSGGYPFLIYFDISGTDGIPLVVIPPGFGDWNGVARIDLSGVASGANQNIAIADALEATIKNDTWDSGIKSGEDCADDFTPTGGTGVDATRIFTSTVYGNEVDATVSDTTHIKDGGGTTIYNGDGSDIYVRTDCAGKLLRAELLNIDNTVWEGTPGGSSWDKDDRIYIKVFAAVKADLSGCEGSGDLQLDVSSNPTVCILSMGNPIIDLSDSSYNIRIDGSESFSRDSDIGISAYYIDDDSLQPSWSSDALVTATIQTANAPSNNLGNVSDSLASGLSLGSISSKSLSYTHHDEGYLRDEDKRYLDFYRLIRLQVEDDFIPTTGSGDISNRRSFIEHYDDDNYVSTVNDGSLRVPTSQQTRSYIGYSNNDTVEIATWHDLTALSRTNEIMVGGGSTYDLRHADDTRLMDGATLKYSSTPHPKNFILITKTDKFNKIYFRMGNTYTTTTAGSAIEVDITAWYSHADGWKPLEIVDGTRGLKTSGSISFRQVEDWQSVTSDGIEGGNWTGPVPSSSAAADADSPEDLWDFSAYGILIGINVKTDPTTKIAIRNIWTFDNSHSQLIKVVDGHHVSLNDIAMTESISFSRGTKFSNITNKFGKSEIRKLGAAGGVITFGGVDLGDTDASGNRKKMKGYQQNATPVYMDVTHKSGEKTRFFGVITSMSESHPVGGAFPKFSLQMQVSYIIEIDSVGDLLSDKISIGGTIDGERKYISSMFEP
tara:strand:- start:1566 stop:4661 length:3096 start_codon:yes stop_codon:yes gene_type:complete